MDKKATLLSQAYDSDPLGRFENFVCGKPPAAAESTAETAFGEMLSDLDNSCGIRRLTRDDDGSRGFRVLALDYEGVRSFNGTWTTIE